MSVSVGLKKLRSKRIRANKGDVGSRAGWGHWLLALVS